jgi:chromosome segregation ATPase
MLLGRPLTFWDTEQIDYIKIQEARAVLYENTEYKKVSQKMKDIEYDIQSKEQEVHELEVEIANLQDEVDDLECERNTIAQKIIEKNPYLKWIKL